MHWHFVKHQCCREHTEGETWPKEADLEGPGLFISQIQFYQKPQAWVRLLPSRSVCPKSGCESFCT